MEGRGEEGDEEIMRDGKWIEHKPHHMMGDEENDPEGNRKQRMFEAAEKQLHTYMRIGRVHS